MVDPLENGGKRFFLGGGVREGEVIRFGFIKSFLIQSLLRLRGYLLTLCVINYL